MDISVLVYQIKNDEEEVLGKILGFLTSKLKEEAHIGTTDINSFVPDFGDNNPVVCFGKAALSFVDHGPSLLFELPPLSKLLPKEENSDSRSKALKEIEVIAEKLNESLEKENWTKEVELPCGATASTDNGISDITLTEREVDLLLTIKKLLNGSKIVLTKGAKRIEVE